MSIKKNGTIRTQRLPKDLLDNPFQIDARSSWDLLGYMVAYLEKLNYYNLDNKIEGNWKKLVENDPVIYAVIIINTPTTAITKLLDKSRTNKDFIFNKEEVLTLLTDWYEQIVRWQYDLLNCGEKHLGEKLKKLIRDVLEDEKSKVEKTLGSPEEEKELLDAADTLYKIILHIKDFTKSHLTESMFRKHTHLPHNAMYIAFVRLYKIVQDKLNSISRRHLDFYYKDILQQKPLEGRNTRATLVFELLPTEAQTLIDKGTLVSAGKMFGSRNEVHFKTDKPLRVHQIEISEMQTLFFNTNPYLNIGTDQPVISSVQKSALLSDGKMVEDKHDWFVFGANKETLQNTVIDPKKSAHLGFIIGSPVLALEEGNRSISVHLNLTEMSAKESLLKLVQQIQKNKKITLEHAFAEVFDYAFNTFYTTEKGWVPFSNYSATFANNTLSVHFELQKIAPAVTLAKNLSPTLQWPSIKIVLNEYAPIFAYPFLQNIALETIRIDVNVRDMRNLALYNNVGKMPLGKSFEVFGPTPSKGNFLLIGKNELFRKNLETVAFNLHWETIPETYGGFTTYYDGYSKEVNNESFIVQLQALNNSYWVPLEEKTIPTAHLFSTEKCTTPEGYESEILCSTTTLTIPNFESFDTSLDFNGKEPLKYEVNSQSGFFKITLAAPSFGFGSDIYQQEFTEIATYNAKNKRQVPFPNKPFVPKLKGVTVNYSASDTLYFDSNPPDGVKSEKNLGEFIHIRPFGYDVVIAQQKVKQNLLLPRYDAQGYFFMGLKKVTGPMTVTLFFHFLRSGTTVKIEKNSLVWEYFHIDGWKTFTPEQIINDGTGGLTKTGIIELVLPAPEQTIESVDDSLFWIRIATKKAGQHYPKVKGVYLNAVQARCISEEVQVLGATLPPNSIDTIVQKNAAIKRVFQPANTYAGAMAEKESTFYSRVSERLRHKSRAVAAWDYERLILEHFDMVKVVKCTNLGANFHPEPGKVKVAVLSKFWTNDERYYFKKGTLEAMQNFLQQRSNPFTSIQVINPTAEYLLVNIVVVFKAEDRGGFYIDELNDAITEYLSPIKNIEHGMGGIGGSVVPNMVLSYVETLPYVKFVRMLSIEHIVGKTNRTYTYDDYAGGAAINSTMPWSILSPVKCHHIIAAEETTSIATNTLQVGIRNMEIGLDFILKDNPVVFPSMMMQAPKKKAKDAIFSLKPKKEKK